MHQVILESKTVTTKSHHILNTATFFSLQTILLEYHVMETTVQTKHPVLKAETTVTKK